MSRCICVFCASSSKVSLVYVEAARELGTILGRRRDTLIFGGTRLGLMAALADAVRGVGGSVIGVVPQSMVDHGIADKNCKELVVTPDMRIRKTVMEERADAFIALPGGFGTLEEVFEILALKLLKHHDKPVVLINTQGFYDKLLVFLEQLFSLGFAREKYRHIYQVATEPAAALDLVEQDLKREERCGDRAVRSKRSEMS